jgi:hypothetical protein
MKPLVYTFTFILSCVTLLGSCGLGDAAEESEKYANLFHSHLKNQDEQGMMEMIHEDALATNKEDFEQLIKTLSNNTRVKTVKKDIGFNTNVNNGITTVTLNYTLTLEDGAEVAEEMILRDSQKGGMKIMGLQYN